MRSSSHKGKPPDRSPWRRQRRRRRPVLLLGGVLLVFLLLLVVHEAEAFAAGTPPPPSASASASSAAGKGGKKRGGGGGGGGGGAGNRGRRGGGGGGSGNRKKDASSPTQPPQPQQKQAPRMAPRLMPVTQAKDAREAAYLAALGAERDQMFISDALQEWARAKKPTGAEMGLATLVASVACREAASLDYAIRQLAGAEEAEAEAGEGKGKGKGEGPPPVRLKGRQRVVLRTALAQYKYCTKTPLYAIVDHAVGLAKRYGGGPSFAAFANALLRKLPPDSSSDEGRGGGSRDTGKAVRPLPLPVGDSVEALAARLSFPPFLVRLLIEDLGLPLACQVMEASNTFPPTMARGRTGDAAVPTLDDGDDDDDDAATAKEADTAALAAAATTTGAESGGEGEVLAEPEAAPEGAAASVPIFEPVAPTDLPPALAQSPAPLPYPLVVVRAKRLLRRLTQDPRWYITNGTPAGLIARLAEGATARILGAKAAASPSPSPLPLRVLDVCAAPGGKGLAVWDVVRVGQGHPVTLVMNDVSEEKAGRIRENLEKFGLLSPQATTTTSITSKEEDKEEEKEAASVRITIGDGAALSLKGEADDDEDPGYDVVIVDAPCSNAGVLGRRPEARWRLADDRLLSELEGTQLSLLRSARGLLSRRHPDAEVWYMTCSILTREDEGLVARACAELGLEVVDRALEMKVLPGQGGLGGAFDGGYAVALRRRQRQEAG